MVDETLLLPAILGGCILTLKLSPFPGFGETFRSIVASDAAANFAFDFVLQRLPRLLNSWENTVGRLTTTPLRTQGRTTGSGTTSAVHHALRLGLRDVPSVNDPG